MHHALAFIVVGATGPDFPFAYFRFKRGRCPQFKRINWHHIHVSIYQYSGFGRIDDFFAEGHRISIRFIHFGTVSTRIQQGLLPVFGCPVHFWFVGFNGADRRNPDQSEQFLQKTVFVCFNILFDVFHVEYF